MPRFCSAFVLITTTELQKDTCYNPGSECRTWCNLRRQFCVLHTRATLKLHTMRISFFRAQPAPAAWRMESWEIQAILLYNRDVETNSTWGDSKVSVSTSCLTRIISINARRTLMSSMYCSTPQSLSRSRGINPDSMAFPSAQTWQTITG